MSFVINFMGNVVNGVARLPGSMGNVVYSTAYTASGIVGTALSVLSLGLVNKFNHTASFTANASYILPAAYRGVIGILNNEIYDVKDSSGGRGKFRNSAETLFYRANTLASAHIHVSKNAFINDVIKGIYNHLGSRLTYAVAAVAAVVARVADLILGVAAAALSLLFLGQLTEVNAFALKNLTVFGMIDDLSLGIRGVVNPYQNHLL